MSHVVGHVDEYENEQEFDARTRRAWYTPQQEFAQVVGAQTPQFAYQAPYTTRRNELLTRYQLADPWMRKAGQEPTFADYVGTPGGANWGAGVGAWREGGLMGGLTARAMEASRIGALSDPDIAELLTTSSEEDANRAAWYYGQFGPSNRAQTQLDLASMLAMQRPGGGQYGGRMGQAIRDMLARAQAGQTAGGGAPEDFLNWYLGTPGGQTRVGAQ